MKLKLNKIIFYIAAVVIALVVITINYYFQPRLLDITPRNGDKNVNTTTKITLKFNKEITTPRLVSSGDGLIISPTIIGNVNVEGKEVIITPQNPLTANQLYEVTLKNLTTNSGKVIKTKTLTFTTASYSTIETNSQKTNFLKSLPITTSSYSLDYISATNTFSVDISDGNESDIRKEITTLLANNGFDPNQTKVTYYLQPTAGGTGGP